MHTQQRLKNIRVFKLISSTVLIFAVSVCLYIFNQHQQIENNEITRIKNSHLQGLNFASERLNSVVEGVDDILKKLATSPQALIYSQTQAKRDRGSLEDMFYFIAKNEPIYSEIRYIDNAGVEKIHVNNLASTTVRVNSAQLQDKSTLPYYMYATQLQEGEIGTWHIDFKNEKTNESQLNFKVIAPVFSQQQRLGFIVINLNVNHILDTIEGLQTDQFITKILNKKGEFLASNNPTDALTMMPIAKQSHHIESHHVANSSPSILQHMILTSNGQFTSEDKTYSYAHLALNPAYKSLGEYILIASPTSSNIVLVQKRNLMVHALLLLIMLVGVGVYMFKLYNNFETDEMNSQLIEAAFNGVTGVMITNKFFQLMKVNQEFERISGYSEKELQGESLSKLQLMLSQKDIANIKTHLAKNNIWKGEIQGQSKSGASYALITRIQVLKSTIGAVIKYVITFIDISQRKLLEEELRNQSQSDALTNIWNRRKFDAELESLAMATGRYPSHHACLGIIDIDYFKKINDTYGHDAGDKSLRDLANFLLSQCRDTDVVARIGGEEFAILMPHTNMEQGLTLLNRLRAQIESNTQLGFTVSGGITPILADAMLTYKHADIAMYNAKSAGRNQVKQFISTLREHKAKLTVVTNINTGLNQA